MQPLPKKLYEKFFSDPDWVLVEEAITEFVNNLCDTDDIDMSQSGADVKGEIKARKKLRNNMENFLSSTGIVGRKPSTDNSKTFF